jgi:GNAT superfamily N-acetyltransferase
MPDISSGRLSSQSTPGIRLPRVLHEESQVAANEPVGVLTSRPAIDLADLRSACDVLTRAWLAGSSTASAMRGDLAWWYVSCWPTELPDRLRLWQLDGETVAWSWSDGTAIEYGAWLPDPAASERVERAILAFAVDEAEAAVDAWTADDDPAKRSMLAALGFVPAPGHGRLSQFQRTVGPGDAIEDRPLPAGYRIRSFAGLAEVDARVDAHRAAFAPSTMRVEKYERMLGIPEYRLEDDLVVEAPDGSIASFAIAWWDPVARVGVFEPVGTDPLHQRRGISAALLCHALRRYRDLGAVLVQVFSVVDNAPSEALYQSVGFRRKAFFDGYRRMPQSA